jgi:hypothetical protein
LTQAESEKAMSQLGILKDRPVETTLRWRASERLDIRERMPPDSPVRLGFQFGEPVTLTPDVRQPGCRNVLEVPVVMQLEAADDTLRAELRGAMWRAEGQPIWYLTARVRLSDARGTLDLVRGGQHPVRGELAADLYINDERSMNGTIYLQLWYADSPLISDDTLSGFLTPAGCLVPIGDSQPAGELGGHPMDTVVEHFARARSFLESKGELPTRACSQNDAGAGDGIASLRLLELVPNTGCLGLDPRVPGQTLRFDALVERELEGTVERFSVPFLFDPAIGRDGPEARFQPASTFIYRSATTSTAPSDEWLIDWPSQRITGRVMGDGPVPKLVWPAEHADALCRAGQGLVVR